MNAALFLAFVLLPFVFVKAGDIGGDSPFPVDEDDHEETAGNSLLIESDTNKGNTDTAEKTETPVKFDFNSTKLAELKAKFESQAEESSDRSFFFPPMGGYGGWGMRPMTGLMSGCTWIMNSPGKAVCCRYTCNRIFYCYYY